jgi:hypothetical protein
MYEKFSSMCQIIKEKFIELNNSVKWEYVLQSIILQAR